MEISTNTISMTFALIFPYVVVLGICAVLAIIAEWNITTLFKTFKSNTNLVGTNLVNTPFAKIALVLFIGIGASGCANMKDQHKSPEIARPLPAISQLAKASDIAAFSLALLSRIESSRTPIAPPKADGLVPDILEKSVTITWTGPLDGLVRKLAKLSSFDFHVLGKPPVSPIIISIAAQDKALIEVFRNIGLQAGTRALVIVNAQQSKVEVIYEN